jgi:choline-sulfatase
MRILYIDVDSLRPDHLSCYGYHRQTSPNIDALARDGVRFENVYATDTPCLPSRTAFFGGRFGINTGVVNHGGVYADLPAQGESRSFRTEFAENTLASVLRRAGYHTSSISPFPNRHSAYQIWYGFTETYDTGKGGVENADEIYPHVKRWLGQNAQQDNWFLHVNLWDPHTPYDHPESYGNPFEDEPIDAWLTQEIIDAQLASFGSHSANEVPGYTNVLPEAWRMGVGEIKTLSDAKAHIDGYDTGIHYADFYIGKIIQDLKDLGIYDDTAIILCADHGENQGELNVWGDHQTADQGTNHLPLIIRWPGVTQGGNVRRGLYYHLDLTATLAELVGGTIPKSWDGSSLAPALSGNHAGRDYLVLSQGAWSCQRSVRWGEWLLIRTYHTGLKNFPAYMLFNLEDDPHETTNLAASHRSVLNEGLQKLDAWVAEQMPKALRPDPFWGVIAEGGPLHANERSRDWQNYLERLKATGRGQYADKLKKFGGRPWRSGLEE